MALETASFLDGLVATNPAAGDPVSQGDDHIRLLKSVLKATFPGLNKAIAFPLPVADGGTGASTVDGARTALLNYEVGTFLPTFGISTPGDLSVSYTSQLGRYVRIANFVAIQAYLSFTPTFTTATGNLRIDSFPFTSISTPSGLRNNLSLSHINGPGLDLPTGIIQFGSRFDPNTAYTFLGYIRDNSALPTWELFTDTHLNSGSGLSLSLSGVYTIAS